MSIISIGFLSFVLGMVALIGYLIYTGIESFEKLVRGRDDSVSLIIIFVALIMFSWPIAIIMYLHFADKAEKSKTPSS